MHEIYRIYPSNLEIRLLAGLHVLTALVWYWCVNQKLLLVSGLLLIGLLGWREVGRLRQAAIIELGLNLDTGRIRIVERGQTYFYNKYKVYPSRWFAILKLVNQRQSRTLILHPECFENLNDYRRLRYCLRQTEMLRAA